MAELTSLELLRAKHSGRCSQFPVLLSYLKTENNTCSLWEEASDHLFHSPPRYSVIKKSCSTSIVVVSETVI